MALSNRSQNVLLGMLTVLAVSASGYTVWSVNQPHPSLKDGVSTTPAAIEGTAPGPADDEAVTATASSQGEVEEATQTAVPTQEPVETETAEPAELTTGEWLAALEGDGAALQVIGDGYSNMVWQWLQQWAGILAQQRPVEIMHWGEAEDVTYNPPIVLSEGDGPELSVWSASRAGTSIADARERLDRFQDEAEPADAVLISLGGASEGEDVAAEMSALLEDLPEVPIMVVIAPEGLYPDGVADALADWAEGHTERVVLIDLRETAVSDASAEAWALAFQTMLMERAAQDG